jgi:Tfp pilus assembly protein PilF
MVSIEGVVEIRTATAIAGAWTPARLQQNLCAGDQVAVRERGRAAIELVNQVVVRLSQKTTLTLVNISPDQPAELGLIEGVIHVLTRFVKRFSVVAPYMNALVEGTEFTVEAQAQRTRISVTEGQVRAVNGAGEQSLSAGLAAEAVAGGAPSAPQRIQPLEFTQWALYYPVILNERSPAALQQANALLALGRVNEAQALMAPLAGTAAALSLQAVIAVARNDSTQALTLAQQAQQAQPDLASAALALSLAYQALGRLESATEAANRATRLEPQFAVAWARLAELKLLASQAATGRSAAQRALALDPSLPRARTVLGFAALMDGEIEAALSLFEQAKGVNASDPQAWLGTGLILLRRGDLSEGRRHLEIAVILDPGNAELRSALARAYLQEKRDALAAKELELAKRLDPRNPTPWYTDAVRKQQDNDPAGAVQDYERALALNDNRAVVRPRLLLNQDQAGRTISLASAYGDLGFDALMLNAAQKAVADDPQSPAAHHLLAQAHVPLARYETARVSEQLQAQLRAPLGTAPIAPQALVPGLPILGGPRTLSPEEFSPLYEQKMQGLNLAVLTGSQSTQASSLLAYQAWERVQLSFGHFLYDTRGFWPESDLRLSANNLLLQAQLAPSLQAQLEVRAVRRDGGDVTQRINPLSAEPERRRAQDSDSVRFGLRQNLSAQSEWLLSVVSTRREDASRDISRTFIPGPNFTLESRSSLFSPTRAHYAEAQYLHQGERQSVTTGLSLYQDDASTYLTASSSGTPSAIASTASLTNSDLKHRNAYLYHQVRGQHWRLYTGLAADDFERTDGLTVRSLSPKAGLQYAAEYWNLRAAWYRGVKGSAAREQALEPTQFAQFNQVFDDANGTRYQRSALAADYAWHPELHTGLELSRRQLQVYDVGCTGGNCTGAWTEQAHRAYLAWRLHPRWALNVDWVYDSIHLQRLDDFNIPVAVVTQQVPVNLTYFASRQWKLGLEWRGVNQSVDNRSQSRTTQTHSRFAVVNMALRYGAGQQAWALALELNNIFDKTFRFQNTSLNDEPRVPLFQPERSIHVRVSLKL